MKKIQLIFDYLCFAAAMDLFLWGCDRGAAQSLSLSVPIVVQAAQVDHRYGVLHPEGVISQKQGLPYKGKVGLAFKAAHQPEVEALARYGVLSQCPVYVMDGTNLIAMSHIVGVAMATFQTGDGPASEYGYLLNFSSEQEAEKVALLMRREPPKPPMSKQEMEGLIRRYKPDLDDRRFWRAPYSALEPSCVGAGRYLPTASWKYEITGDLTPPEPLR